MNWRTRLRSRMKELSVSQSEVARQLGPGVGRAAFNHYLTKMNHQPNVDTFKRICEILDVSADWLLFGDVSARPSETLSKPAQRVAKAWTEIPKDKQRDIEAAIRVFRKSK